MCEHGQSGPLDTLTTNSNLLDPQAERPREVSALVVVWSREAPGRVGEVLLPDPRVEPGQGWVFGRGEAGDDRLALLRQRPGENQGVEPLGDRRISEQQLRIRSLDDGGLELRNLGRRTLLVDGVEVKRSRRVQEGMVVELRGQLMFLVARRPLELPGIELPDPLCPAFGQPDSFGMLGESPAAWVLRRQLAFAALRDVHVLIQGPSGVGKELAARAIHELSTRGARAMVARNAATLPEALVDAELFGNRRDYPNPGMPERPGLIGAADGGSLLLDEIGELSHELQAHLLRVLDSGEYQRLGEASTRRADLRLIAATNRPLAELKHDFVARLRLRVEVPALARRREDIGLLIPHLVANMARADPMLAHQFFPDGDPSGAPRIGPGLVRGLLGRPFPTNVRELDTALWNAMMHSVLAGQDHIRDVPAEAPAELDPGELTREQLEAALAHADGVQERAWRLLGLRNRYQLIRLLKKHGLN